MRRDYESRTELGKKVDRILMFCVFSRTSIMRGVPHFYRLVASTAKFGTKSLVSPMFFKVGPMDSIVNLSYTLTIMCNDGVLRSREDKMRGRIVMYHMYGEFRVSVICLFVREFGNVPAEEGHH